jgi:hypothetical protein
VGNYINKLPDGTGLLARGKSDAIATVATKELLALPYRFGDVPLGQVLVCVVDNGPFSFEAALVCDTERDWRRVHYSNTRSLSPRPTRYFIIDRDDARQMADEPLDSEAGL